MRLKVGLALEVKMKSFQRLGLQTLTFCGSVLLYMYGGTEGAQKKGLRLSRENSENGVTHCHNSLYLQQQRCAQQWWLSENTLRSAIVAVVAALHMCGRGAML